MITFGDGPEPIPTACATALLATRQCLQTAIKDARALRRHMKREYDKAKVAVNLHKAKKKERSILGVDAENAGAGGVDMNLYFQAITSTGHDKLSKDNPTGFDETQLEKLFPEEMYAYKRWNKMHQAYTASKHDDARSTGEKSVEPQVDEDEKDEIKNAATLVKDGVGGHLRDRLSQFDVRTDRMMNQWYLAFSEVRKGSFLMRGGLSSEDRTWEKERKKLPGKRKTNTWEALPSSHIQFLHWVGFDQRSPLPPPDASTTEALAFLGYDFCGKIIEKAIFIKCLEKREGLRQSGVSGMTQDEHVLELGRDEQLTKEDIEKALNDSTVVPKPLYNSSNATLQATDAAQIYFGPGFEERIEMEMEQIFMGKTAISQLTPEEIAIRKKEDELFENMKQAPEVLNGVMDVLGDKAKTESVAIQRSNDKKRRAVREAKKLSKLKDAMEEKEAPEPVTRKRGRPRKAVEQTVKRKRGRPRTRSPKST